MSQTDAVIKIVKLSEKDRIVDRLKELDSKGLLNCKDGGFKKWHWKYVENPFSSQSEVPAWIAILDGKIVGYLGAMPVRLKVNSQIVNAAWAVDFMALSQQRRKGIGRLLVEEANKSYEAFLTVSQTDASFNLFIKMGWRHLGDLLLY